MTVAPASLPPAPAFGTPVPQHAAPEVLDFLALRRSTSAMMLAAPGPSDAEIAQLIRLAARVPDHGKLAPWRFILLPTAEKAAFAARLEALALSRDDAKSAAKLAKLKVPPMGIAVVSSVKPGQIPEWEQLHSAGAVCTTLLYAAQALGYGANWITDWYAYDPQARSILGLDGKEQVAGFVLMGTPREPALERERPDPAALVTRWG